MALNLLVIIGSSFLILYLRAHRDRFKSLSMKKSSRNVVLVLTAAAFVGVLTGNSFLRVSNASLLLTSLLAWHWYGRVPMPD
jgi:hypothetical protein